MPLPNYTVENWNQGWITRIEKESLPKGAASDVLNWLTKGDGIELRRGMVRLGTEQTGNGRIEGLFRGTMFDGTERLFEKYNRKLKYYDEDTEDWVEIGSDLLPADAVADDFVFEEYHNIAGAWVYGSSPNSGIYKIPLANPGSAKTLSTGAHKGKISIRQNRMLLWDRKDADGVGDKTGLYGSYVDKDELSDYTEVTAENVGTGDASTTNFTGTLSAVNSTRTVMGVRITDSVETFVDDRDGNLVGDQGGTGTINYATGAFDITFATAPANSQAITADYYWEDATSQGIADFSKSTPRTAGQGFVFRQDDGGAEMQNVGSIGEEEFCLHTRKTWRLTLSNDDTNATNLIYRGRVGIPYFRAMQETGDGIVYMDALDQKNPAVRLLTVSEQNEKIIPKSLSDVIDLSDYRFDKAVVFEWGEYDMVACRHKDSTYNNRLLMRHKIWKAWDIVDFFASTLAEYLGTLVAGDSIADNVYTLFSGFDDDEALVLNHWISGNDDLGVAGLKRVRRLKMRGLLQADQSIEVSLSYDNGPFVLVATISGSGSYVDAGQSISVGSNTVGSKEVGGGSDGVTANPFTYETKINTDKFERVRYKFEAVGLGYAKISLFELKDLRYKGRKSPNQYVT